MSNTDDIMATVDDILGITATTLPASPTDPVLDAVLARMRAIPTDPEEGPETHVEADRLLIEALRHLGQNDLADAWELIPREGYWE